MEAAVSGLGVRLSRPPPPAPMGSLQGADPQAAHLLRPGLAAARQLPLYVYIVASMMLNVRLQVHTEIHSADCEEC
uniref:Uncharacterized protein n=1 Tax=Panthera leo TaxID=9689 RepID=A0A8C8WYP3_PANLE